jgi:hypothetical protein
MRVPNWLNGWNWEQTAGNKKPWSWGGKSTTRAGNYPTTLGGIVGVLPRPVRRETGCAMVAQVLGLGGFRKVQGLREIF